jgi:hypothetical protein
LKVVHAAKPMSEKTLGLVTSIAIADGSELGLYQPKLPVAIAT